MKRPSQTIRRNDFPPRFLCAPLWMWERAPRPSLKPERVASRTSRKKCAHISKKPTAVAPPYAAARTRSPPPASCATPRDDWSLPTQGTGQTNERTEKPNTTVGSPDNRKGAANSFAVPTSAAPINKRTGSELPPLSILPLRAQSRRINSPLLYASPDSCADIPRHN